MSTYIYIYPRYLPDTCLARPSEPAVGRILPLWRDNTNVMKIPVKSRGCSQMYQLLGFCLFGGGELPLDPHETDSRWHQIVTSTRCVLYWSPMISVNRIAVSPRQSCRERVEMYGSVYTRTFSTFCLGLFLMYCFSTAHFCAPTCVLFVIVVV